MKIYSLLKKTLPLILVVSSLLVSCQKESIQPTETTMADAPKSSVVRYTVRNERMPFYYQGKNGVEHFSPRLRTETDYPDCEVDFDDNEEYVYLGSSVIYDCGTGDATITMLWTFVVPANTVASVGTNTRIRYRFSTSDPYQYSTNVTVNIHTPTYTNPNTGQSVQKWVFSGTFPVPSGEYCMKNAFYGSIYKVEIDCIEVGEYTKPAVVDYLTPNTYEVSTLDCYPNSPGSLSFNVVLNNTLCTSCHDPALGASPEYIVRYRKVGTSTWTYYGVNQAYTPPTVTVTVSSTGTYEFEWCAKLTSGSPGTYTSYTSNWWNSTFTIN